MKLADVPCGAAGGLNFHVSDGEVNSSASCSRFTSDIASFSSRAAPIKFVPQSDNISAGAPRLAMNPRTARMQDEVVNVLTCHFKMDSARS